MEFFKNKTNFPFMGTRKIWYSVSIAMILLSIGLLIFRGLNLAVDFTGGVTAEISFPGEADLDRVRTALDAAGFHEAQVQNFGSSRDVMVRLPPVASQTAEQIRTALDKVVAEVDPAARLQRVEVVGPQIGEELRTSSIWAVAFTIFFIFIYVALRFHTQRLSAGAILAALHDPIIVLGFFAATQMPFDLAVVAAILAVIGYSLNDTIVVFDRIRERFAANRRLSPVEVLDESINSTLSRTIMTAVTTLIVVVILYLFGGAALQGFSAVIIVGILVGTYSSIYIASALALDFGLKAEHVFPSERRRKIDDLP
ncbi:MAG: protein translocase subunit SecF [Sinobacteraceae bacterium]|nr:protein translocase subunit SecF [Nevskiaceae bacterium]MCP5467571.1 protein translocase subunit SecF [Nevskiaceae bacterium]MCP5472823.1 protein translocase subunit SecF [Nevskiaceae bacterium]